MQASAVSLDGRALLIEGAPGAGKSSLALALIDRGAALIGDDGVALRRAGDAAHGALIASPPPNIEGLIEVRGVGIVRMAVAPATPVGLILTLCGPADFEGERLPEAVPEREVLGCRVPVLRFRPGTIAPAQRARLALQVHGIAQGGLPK